MTTSTLSVIEQQLAELSPAIDDPDRLVIAYEPVWAIGTGRTATPDQAQEVHAFIRKRAGRELRQGRSPTSVRIQYGGSVKPNNAADLMRPARHRRGLGGGREPEGRRLLGDLPRGDLLNGGRTAAPPATPPRPHAAKVRA